MTNYKICTKLFTKILLMLGIVFTVFYLLFTTTWGLATTLHLVSLWMPGHIAIEKVSGSLASNIDLHGVTYKDGANKFEINHLQAAFSFSALLKKRLEIVYLILDRPIITVLVKSANVKKPILHAKHIKIVPHSTDMIAEDLQKKLRAISINLLQITNADIYYNQQHFTIQHAFVRWNSKSFVVLKSNAGQLVAQFDQQPAHANGIIKLQDFNPGIFNPVWIGNINLALAMQVNELNSNPNFDVHLQSLTGSLRNFPLTGAGSFHYKQGVYIIDDVKLALGKATAEFKGKINDDWDLIGELVVPNLNFILPKAQGSLTANLKMTGSRANPAINANVKSQSISLPNFTLQEAHGDIDVHIKQNAMAKINLAFADMKIADYQILRGKLDIASTRKAQKILTDFNFSTTDDEGIKGNITIDDYANVRQANVAGDVAINVANIARLVNLPFTKNTKGALQGNINLSGKFPQLKMQGKVALKDGNVLVAKTGTHLSNINLEADIASAMTEQKHELQLQHSIQFTGKLAAGKGEAKLSGTADVVDNQVTANLSIQGADLNIIDLPEYKIIASPNLQMTYKEDQLQLDGAVTVPSAKIFPKSFSNVVKLPSETTIVTHRQMAMNLPLDVVMQVKMILGKDIHIKYENLNAFVTGEVMISQLKDSLMTGTGELSATKGTYTAYGKELKITEGRISYAGNLLTNPGLNIRALKQVKSPDGSMTSQFAKDSIGNIQANSSQSGSIRVGIAVQGTVDKPKITLISEPQLAQMDVLSYLVFGSPRSDVKQASNLDLLQTLSTSLNTGPSKISHLKKKFQKSLGLSQFSIEKTNYYSKKNDSPTASNATMVNLSKKINKKLSIQFSKGIFDSISILSIRYQLSKHLAIQSQASTEDRGADILYEFERD